MLGGRLKFRAWIGLPFSIGRKGKRGFYVYGVDVYPSCDSVGFDKVLLVDAMKGMSDRTKDRIIGHLLDINAVLAVNSVIADKYFQIGCMPDAYTGVDDRNGNPIYEHDVVRMPSNSGRTRKGQVFYHDDDARFCVMSGRDTLAVTKDCVVIGNYHEGTAQAMLDKSSE